MAVTEICFDKFFERENVDEFSFTFAYAMKARHKYHQRIKDFSCFCGMGFLWRLFRCGDTFLLTFGSDPDEEFKNHYLLLGTKKHLEENQREVSKYCTN